jgi:hypothetical protein
MMAIHRDDIFVALSIYCLVRIKSSTISDIMVCYHWRLQSVQSIAAGVWVNGVISEQSRIVVHTIRGVKLTIVS